MAKPPGQIVELQSLRGIAATAVMIGHALVYYDTSEWFYGLARLFNGRAAVVVFFVLSGYVLTRSLRNSQFDQDSIRRFYIQRAFRIYPAIWMASGLGLIYIFFLHWQIPVEHVGSLVRSEFRIDRFDALHIVASLAAMTTFIIPQLWTIFIEIVASIALPGIAFVTLHRQGWYPWMLTIAILISLAYPNSYYHVTMYFMDFVIGAALAIPDMAHRLFSKAPANRLVFGCLAALACTQFLPGAYYNPFVHLGETILAATVIGLVIGAKERVEWLASPILLFIGDISFSIYLLHYVVLCTIAKMFVILPLNVNTLSILLAVATCVITVPLAWLNYIYIEKPGIQLGKISLRQMVPVR
jgi:peptidoglycan/LPS O-acetylase OafA/YrhL